MANNNIYLLPYCYLTLFRCKFHEELWGCDHTYTQDELLDFNTRNISAVLYLNELGDDMGGEFVFIDGGPPKLTSTKTRPQQPSAKNNNRFLSSSSDSFYFDSQYQSSDDQTSSRQIPPPTRAQIRRAKEHERRKLAGGGANSKLLKTISVKENGLNYTVVESKVRRLLIFNSSVENIHAVTQMLNEKDRRFTLFMFLFDRDEDNNS
jgi:hypothetical protein